MLTMTEISILTKIQWTIQNAELKEKHNATRIYLENCVNQISYHLHDVERQKIKHKVCIYTRYLLTRKMVKHNAHVHMASLFIRKYDETQSPYLPLKSVYNTNITTAKPTIDLV